MKTKFIAIYAASAMALLILSSCNLLSGYQAVYTPEGAIKKDGFPIKDSIFISNIVDARPADKKANFDPSGSPLLLLPLWPYDHTETSPVLQYTFLQANMLNTVKHLISEDLRASKIFSYVSTETYDVAGPEQAKYAAKIPDNAYVLETEITKAIWSRYMTAYGLSLPGTFLWFIAPESYGSVIVSLEFKLYSPNDRQKPIAQTVITKEISCTEWAYDQINYMPPVSEFKLAEMFPDIMTGLRAFLVNSLDSKK